MCLTCSRTHPTIRGKEEIEQVFYPKRSKAIRNIVNTLRDKGIGCSGNYLHTYTGASIELTHKQIDEIINHALGIIVTGVDSQLDIWAIQWPNDYKVEHLV